jgi:hypothetical protein
VQGRQGRQRGADACRLTGGTLTNAATGVIDIAAAVTSVIAWQESSQPTE